MTKSQAREYYCARCKYPFEATTASGCPLCGTVDVEPRKTAADWAAEKEEDDDG